MFSFIKKTIKFLLIIFGLMFVLICIVSNSHDKDKTSLSENSNNEKLISPPAIRYVLNQKELNILDAIIEDDRNSFLDGNNSLIGDSLKTVTTYKVVNDYNKNQVAADQKYYNKTVLLMANIESINSGLGNEPYISLVSNSLISPQIRFKNNDIDRISNLSKGQKISIICNGDGAIGGIPMFDNCEFSDIFANKKLNNLKKDIINFLENNASGSKITAMFAITIIALGENINNDLCVNTKSCMQQILKYHLNSPHMKSELVVTAKKLGIDYNKIKSNPHNKEV